MKNVTQYITEKIKLSDDRFKPKMPNIFDELASILKRSNGNSYRLSVGHNIQRWFNKYKSIFPEGFKIDVQADDIHIGLEDKYAVSMIPFLIQRHTDWYGNNENPEYIFKFKAIQPYDINSKFEDFINKHFESIENYEQFLKDFAVAQGLKEINKSSTVSIYGYKNN
jgi:hypothetical protein